MYAGVIVRTCFFIPRTIISWSFKCLRTILLNEMSPNFYNTLKAPERSRSCVGLSTPLTSRPSDYQSYRSLSFNSSGRSLIGEDNRTLDMSLDTDMVTGLASQMNALEEKMFNMDLDMRCNASRSEKALLQNRILDLEEKLLDNETLFAERMCEEQRRYKELNTRMEREMSLLTENKTITVRVLDDENERLRKENKSLQSKLEQQETVIEKLQNQLQDVKIDLTEQLRKINEELLGVKQELLQTRNEFDCKLTASRQEIGGLAKHIKELSESKEDSGSELENLLEELSRLREDYRLLQETNNELKAAVLNSSGTTTEGCCSSRSCDTAGSCNLAAELEAFVSEQTQMTMSDIQEENVRLRHYLESLLLKIVRHYPQILEIKKA